MRPTVLTIAGSDSCGGAGIQADLKAIEANGAYAASVVTGITAQNTRGVERAEALPADLVRDQLRAVFSDLRVAAIKSGMLADSSVIDVVATCLREVRPAHYVLDPVMIAKSGHSLLAEDCAATLADELLPLASLVTPNVHEAEVLSGLEVKDVGQAIRAGTVLIERGAGAALVKGGHLRSHPATDVLVTPQGHRLFEGELLDTPHTHGTGCTYGAAIAAQLAHGHDLERAVERSKKFITLAIRHGLPVGRGQGPTDPFFFLHHPQDRSWNARADGEARRS